MGTGIWEEYETPHILSSLPTSIWGSSPLFEELCMEIVSVVENTIKDSKNLEKLFRLVRDNKGSLLPQL